MEAIAAGLSGMRSAAARLQSSAHNVANAANEDARTLRTVQLDAATRGSRALSAQAPEGEGVDLAREFVEQIRARTQFEASARAVSAGLDLEGHLIDLFV